MKIIVECYGDTLLVKQLKFDALAVHSGIGEVANLMLKYYKNKIAIGIIDSDKKAIPNYFKEFKIDGTVPTKHVTFLKHPKQNHYLIKIVPAFEGFISNTAIECGIERKTHRVPLDDKEFRILTKDKELEKNARFINFLNAVVNKKPESFKEIKECIERAQKAK